VESDVVAPSDAMTRLADRQAASGEAGSLKAEGFEASVHKIKEQVLPRLLERVDPEAARRWARTSSPRSSARSSARCSPS
jgi:pilus assembly protein CpaF